MIRFVDGHFLCSLSSGPLIRPGSGASAHCAPADRPRRVSAAAAHSGPPAQAGPSRTCSLFHVSERACPVHAQRPAAGHPSHAVTIFLHESYGEERILRVLDFLQCPPWQYHHTESCGAGESGINDPSSALLRPYLLPSRDFYSLGAGMPVWGVRPVHYGGEVVRVTLHSTYDNFEDTVRLYETVLQRRVEEQKTGFCWFTLFTEAGFSLQLAIKQLAPGVHVEPCYSAVLQFRVGEIGQLVPLLPNTCSPISASRWHTEDLDGNKILFQVGHRKRALVSMCRFSVPS